MCSSDAMSTISRIKNGENRLHGGSGVASSGGIGFGMPATKQSQSTRMARTASSANFMALFGPQTQGA